MHYKKNKHIKGTDVWNPDEITKADSGQAGI